MRQILAFTQQTNRFLVVYKVANHLAFYLTLTTLSAVTFLPSAQGQEICSRLFIDSSAISNVAFLNETPVTPIDRFKTPPLRTYFQFPRERIEIIRSYSDSLYSSLNAELVKDQNIRNPLYINKKNDLNEALLSLPSVEANTYSGAALRPETFHSMNLQEGKTIKFEYFFSTSLKQKIASRFIKEGMKNKGRVPVLFVVEGKSGRNIKPLSVWEYESEILFRPETEFIVKSIKPLRLNLADYLGMRKGYQVNLQEVAPQLATIPKRLNKIQNRKNNRLEAQRLIDPNDWATANKLRPHDPWNYYGEDTFKQWTLADAFLNSLPIDEQLNIEIIEKVHMISMKGHKYSGWQKRMVRDKFRKGKYSENQALNLLDKIDQGLIEVNVDQAGNRSLSNDFYTHSGDNETPSHHRFFTRHELELLLANPFYAAETNQITKVNANLYLAELHYIYPQYVDRVSDLVISHTNQMLKNAANDWEYIWAVTKFQHAMLSIHPFADGNGRTIRLIGDWLLRKRNLPVPLYPITTELNMTQEEYFNATIKSMNAYLESN